MHRFLGLACGLLLLASAPSMAGNYEAGKEKAKACAACHGADGNSTAPDFPKLAGQHQDYIIKSLQGYKAGTRKNAIMAPMAATLSQRDIEDVAAYYSKQQGLVTAK